MITSIRRLLEQRGTAVEQSLYRDMPEDILDFPLTIGDFIEHVDAEKVVEQFGILKVASETLRHDLEHSRQYVDCQRNLELINKEIKEVKRKEKELENPVFISQEDKIRFKERRRKAKEELEEIVQRQTEHLVEQLGYDWREQKGLCYKSSVYFTWLTDLKKRLPILKQVTLQDMEQIPLFVSKIEDLEEAVLEKAPVGMVGGPCLFGLDEVFLHIDMKNGQRISFDCSCGRRCLKEEKTEATLEEFIEESRNDIEDLVIENKKEGITRQEYDSILYLFEVASVLDAKVVIPLPDMSYFKYMDSDLKGLSEEKRKPVFEIFTKECYRITDMYLEVIKEIADRYPKVKYTVMHHRNQELCDLFYKKRASYITNSSYIQKITNINGKKDAVIDYITMLALPYYIYGTKYVVQLDSIDETDSGRKCRKIHKNDLKYTQILYPERLSRDGRNTIYCAPYEYKDYVRGKG